MLVLGQKRCGKCGSGITADEKFKKLKDGGVNRHVYYLCTKSRNIDCKNSPINEEDLICQMIEMVDKMNLDELGLKERIAGELRRYNRFRTSVLGVRQEKTEVTDLDVRNYAKYILGEGTLVEKRELLLSLRSRITLRDKELHLEK